MRVRLKRRDCVEMAVAFVAGSLLSWLLVGVLPWALGLEVSLTEAWVYSVLIGVLTGVVVGLWGYWLRRERQ